MGFRFAIFLLTASVITFSSCENKVAVQDQNPAVNSFQIPEEFGESPNWNKSFSEALRLGSDGKYKEAIAEMKKAQKIKAWLKIPNYEVEADSVMREWIAKWHRASGDHEAEAAAYREMIEIDPRDMGAHWGLAMVLIKDLHRYDEGLKEAIIYRESLQGTDLYYYCDGLVAEAYEGLGDKENALKHYKVFFKSVSYAPDSNDYKNAKQKIKELESDS